MSSPLPHFLRTTTKFLLSATLAFSLASCEVATEDPIDDSDRADEQDLLEESNGYRNNPLLIEYPGDFDMCFNSPDDATAAAGHGVDLTIAKWLSFFAANEYAHYAHFSPVLEKMGFGDEGEGENWVQDARNVMVTRDLEYTQKVLNSGSSAEFERDLVQKVVPGKKIQFFAAGVIEDDVFVDESTQMLWVEHRTEPVVIISFRGTQADQFEDIVSDLDLVRTDLSGYGAVHGGFHTAFQGIESILKEKLEAESGRGLQIWITGHSLGGALASIASTTIITHINSDDSYSLKGIYTFGMPRVGNTDYVAAVEQEYENNSVSAMRFRQGDDTVTQLPFQWMGYHHTGHFMHLSAEGIFDFNAADQDPGDTTEYEGAIADHNIVQYNERVIGHLQSSDYVSLSRSCPSGY